MKTITRTGKYLHAIAEGRKDGMELVRAWALCSKPRKRYARHLVEVYGWDVRGAIQRAYIFGYDSIPYSYKEKRPSWKRAQKRVSAFRFWRSLKRWALFFYVFVCVEIMEFVDHTFTTSKHGIM